MLEAAKRTVNRSFLCLVFVVSRSVMPAELSCVICGGIVLLPQVYERKFARLCERCGFYENLIKPRGSRFCWKIIIIILIVVVVVVVIIIIIIVEVRNTC